MDNTELLATCRKYLDLRKKCFSEERTVYHNKLLDLFTKLGIKYFDRENAVEIAQALIVLDNNDVLSIVAKLGV